MTRPRFVPAPAWKLWKYLEALYRIGGWISIKLKKLAEHFGRAVSTIKRWFGMLYRAGVLASERRGPRAPVYQVLIPTTDTCIRPGPICELGTDPQSGATPLKNQVAEYFGTTELAGKTADPALVARIARTVATTAGLERFKSLVAGWLKRRSADGWGIFIHLAEDARRGVRPPEPPPPAPKPKFFIPPEKLEPSAKSILNEFGIDPGRFGLGDR